MLLKVFTKVHVKSLSFVRKTKKIYFRLWIFILSSGFEYDSIATILNFQGFDGKVVGLQFFCSDFDNYEWISFYLEYVVETYEIHNLSNFEQNHIINVIDMIICNLGVIRLPAPPIYEIITNLTILTPLYRPVRIRIRRKKIKISDE